MFGSRFQVTSGKTSPKLRKLHKDIFIIITTSEWKESTAKATVVIERSPNHQYIGSVYVSAKKVIKEQPRARNLSAMVGRFLHRHKFC